jgi:hypothetical protein
MQLLRRDYNPDYWSDDVVERAAALVSKLQPEDWQWLAQSWPNWSWEHQWQLADALMGSGRPGWPILEDMLRSPDVGVATKAAEALQFDPTWPGNPALGAELRRIRDTIEPELVDIVDDLLGRSGPRP